MTDKAALISASPLQSQVQVTRKFPGQGGITLVELVATIVILGIALVGVSVMLGQGLGQSANTLNDTRAVALGYAYLDEILGRRFDENAGSGGVPPCTSATCTAPGSFGPDVGENSRGRYDDVDDFHGLDEGFGVAPPDNVLRDAEGNPRSGYEGFRVRVNVLYAGTDAVVGGAATDAKRVEVRITHSSGADDYYFSAYKGNF